MRIAIIILWTALIVAILSWSKKSDAPTTLNIFTWGGVFDKEMLEAFEKTTNTKIRLSYYTSNEELLVKLKATDGKGYDLLIPSDYAIKLLIEENLLAPLDKTRLDFFSTINPILLHHDYDPQNTYSIPLQWELYGIAYNETDFPVPPSWDAIFEKNDFKIGMTNDATEAFTLAAFYLFGPVETLTPRQVLSVERLLKKQRSWVEAYGMRGDYLIATKNAPLAPLLTAYYFPTSRDFPEMRFSIPQGWTMMSIENVAITATTTKHDLIYQFLNYLYEPENEAASANRYLHFPATMESIPYLNVSQEYLDILTSVSTGQRDFYFFRHLLPESQIRNIWIQTKS